MPAHSWRCHICAGERPREDGAYLVALRNGIYFPACFRCWFIWPDANKAGWPDEGYGHSARRVDDLVRVLQGTA